MSDEYGLDTRLRAELGRLVASSPATATWTDVQSRVRRRRRHRRTVGALAAVAVVAAAGYGGYSIWQEWGADRALLVVSDAPFESLTGVKLELWNEIERVKEQSQSGALAWEDIRRTWEAMDAVYPAAGGPDLDAGSWLNFLGFLQEQLVTQESDRDVDVTIYLEDDPEPKAETIMALQEELLAMPEVENAVYVSKEQALERLKQLFSDQPEIFSGLTDNPLPASLEIRLVAGEEAAPFAARLAGRPGVDQIVYAGFDYQGMLVLLRGLVPSASASSVTTPTPTTTPSATSTSTGSAPGATAMDVQGLWAGNVRTVPERPAALPAAFYEEPGSSAKLVTGAPLWVFAAELSPEEAAAAITGTAAGTESDAQTVVLFAPSEALCELLGVERGIRPSFLGELPQVFTQTPVLVRTKPFEETGPFWSLVWADLNPEAATGSNGPAGQTYDPVKAYAVAVSETMAGAGETTTTAGSASPAANGSTSSAGDLASGADGTVERDPYPSFEDVQSEQALELAQKALDQLHALTGLTFSMDSASEQRMVGAGGVVDLVLHYGEFTLAGPEKKHVHYSVFRSGEQQVAEPQSLVGGRPWAVFEAGEGAIGVVEAFEGYSARLQLVDGITAIVSSFGPLHNETERAVALPVAEASPLTPEQLIEFAKWLAAEAGYLRP